MFRLITAAVFLISTAQLAPAFDLPEDLEKAEAGDLDAMLAAGLAYLADQDDKNNEDGLKWLEMSAAGGNIVAYYNLGAIYQDGKQVKQDAQKAVMYLALAAELGEVRAMNRLAGIYYVGELVPNNDVLAIKWGLLAAGLGNEAAQKNIERMRADVSERSAVLGAKAAQAWAQVRLKKTITP